MDLPRGAIGHKTQGGPIASQEGSIPEFFVKS